ncbi:FtsK/SpoIIIE domain-containing protein [Micromonospora yangpuensis]|uniref:FtsK/SpoIIIE domain-containing protein n=1 Tax=Micromonospora yangpuensis TaxID=683228 RepID=UPI000B897F87|nr:FtsK/SpoIIIE domain-containing protein [Micromonospora yangpuensis]GGM30005.1 cell division protein FtsK [Micromonospora yangpuensis]
MDAVAVPKARTGRAAALHRRAAAIVTAAAEVLDEIRPAPADQRRQYELADQLRSAAEVLAPGWAGSSLESLAAETPPGEGPPAFVRIGTGAPLDDARFPAVVPLLGTAHLVVDTDAREPRVAGLLRSVLLRLLAATPAGCLLVRAVDGTGPGEVFAPFGALADAGLLPPAARDLAGLRAVLTEAEQWVAPDAGRHRRRDRTLLVMVAKLPELTGPDDLARLVALAESGRTSGLHLVVAGWPSTARSSLPQATTVTLRNGYALIGDPPGTSFGGLGGGSSGGLNTPVFVAEDPPVELVTTVCRRLAEQVEAGTRLALAGLLPEPETPLWSVSSAAGLSTTVGDAGGRPVPVGFTELTPHWLVSGRSKAGRSAFVTNVLLGLTARYGPEELACHLVDLGPGESFVEFLQTERDRSWIPQVRSAALAADREYVLELFDQLEAEVRRREEAGQRAGGQRFAELREHTALPRIVCVLDNLPLLFGEPGAGPAPDRLGTTVLARLDTLARTGRAYGVHLLLAGEGDLGLGTGSGSRDSMLGQFPVRVALPGGGAVLEPSNDAAAGLPVGSAVVNTAGGLGGPRGATRGHERMVRFPDPFDAVETVTELRRRLWAARPEGSAPPVVFAGDARPSLRNDPRYRAALLGRAAEPAALLGRAVDVARSTVAVPLGPAAGRNLAVLGPGLAAAQLLVTAARATAAHHPPGTARFVIAALTEEARAAAAGLAGGLTGQHTVEIVDLAGLVSAWPGGGPTVLVAFGLDVPSATELPGQWLRSLLREGPPAGTHLLGWWRSVPSFAALLGPEAELGELAAVVAVDMPGAQLTGVLGRPVQWRPRPGRAMLWDGPDRQGTLLVPFAAEDEEKVA